jgi:hypothetical protein
MINRRSNSTAKTKNLGVIFFSVSLKFPSLEESDLDSWMDNTAIISKVSICQSKNIMR